MPTPGRRRTYLPTLGLSIAVAVPAALVLSLPASATHPVSATSLVQLVTAAGAPAGEVRFSAVPGGTRVQVLAYGLTPGIHGFHLHENGSCDGTTTPPFTSAGGHFTATGATHGAHEGDFPPLFVGADGIGRADLVTDALSASDLSPETGSRSRAVIIHAAPDNLANIPSRYRHGTFTDTETGPDAATRATGDSGARVLCGLTGTPTSSLPEVAPAGAAGAQAVLRSPAGAVLGTVSLRQLADRLEVRGRVTGLTPGFHGIHVHTTGACDGATSPPFTSAGGHLVGAGGTHGAHDGDLPALRVRADGTVDLDVDVDDLSVDDLFDADGAALVVHASPDNLANVPTRYRSGAFTAADAGPDAATQATGDSGARSACGVLESSAGAYRSVGLRRVYDSRAGGGTGVSAQAPDEVLVVPGGDNRPYTSALLTVTAVRPAADTRITIGSATSKVSVAVPRGQVLATSVVAPLTPAGTVMLATTGASSHVVLDVQGLFTKATPIGAGRYTPVTPTRLAPVRTLGPGAAERVVVTGRAGVPTSGVGAVAVTLTATRPTASTHLTAYDSGAPKPATSSLNLRVGQTRAAALVVPVGSDGAITIANAAGTLGYLVDVVGWWSSTGTAGGRLVDLPAYDVRSVDDRGPAVPELRLRSGGFTNVALAGVGGVPARGASAVVLAVTVVSPTSRSHLTVVSGDDGLGGTSNLNWLAGETLSTTVVVPLGRNGTVSFFNAGGTAGLEVQVRGYVDAGAAFQRPQQ